MADEQKPGEGAPAGEKKPDEQPKFMTADEFNKASTAREKRLLDKIGEMIKASSPKAPEPPAEEPEETEEEPEEEAVEEPAPAKKAPAAAAAPAKPSKAEIAAKKALAKANAVEKAAIAREDALKKEKADLQAKQERSEILSALAESDSRQPQHALAVLKATGRVKRNEEGDLVFVAQREVAGEKFEEEVSLAEGVKEWLTTEEGKIYAPPKGAEGSGAGPAGKGGKAAKDMSKSERKRAAGQALMKWAITRG